MSRYRGPKTRLSRRLGIILFEGGESKIKAYNKKNYKPGMHGQKHFSQLSEYNKQLQEKQKVRFMYGITERQSGNYYKLATKSNESTGFKFMQYLERRLDNVIYRAGFAITRPQARQIVSHGLVKVNGKKAKTPSIIVKPGETFEIVDKKKTSKLFEDIKKAKKPKTPKWISSDTKELKGSILALPDKNDVEQVVDAQLITEFYSK